MSKITDPVELVIADGLTTAGIAFVHESSDREATKFLDFSLPCADLYIEVKRLHSDRIAKQMSRAPNVIAIQGLEAAVWFISQINRSPEVG